VVFFGALDRFQAFGASEFLTQVAFVCGGKHATASARLTRHHEFAALCRVVRLGMPVANFINFPVFYEFLS
jgi:hypothetical protein